MPISTALPPSFKTELLKGLHDFSASGGHVFKIVLIKANPTGTYGSATTNYSELTGNADEASGDGYTAGGATLTNIEPATSGTTAFLDFADVQWANATLSADGCLIRNTTQADRAVYVGDFGATKTASGGNFDLVFPTPDATNAIIRLA